MNSNIYSHLGGIRIVRPAIAVRLEPLEPLEITQAESLAMKHRYEVAYSVQKALGAKTEREKLLWSMMFVRSWARASGVNLREGEWCARGDSI
jgi:hypothetical protein